MRFLRHLLLVFLPALGPLPAIVAAEPQLQLSSDRVSYPEGTDSEFFIEARITAPDDAAANAVARRNIALVLDRSGSMAGEPIRHLRAAALNAIARLNPADTLAVIAFGSEVETLIEATRVDQARGLIDRIARLEPAGGAALYDALGQGTAQLRRFASAATTSELILVTDGDATRGPREADDFVRLASSIAGDGIRLSAIGLGDAFDEDLLASVARTGNGRFVYAARPEDLDTSLASLLTPAAAVVARELVLTLTFQDYFNQLTAHGWTPAETSSNRLTYRIPYLQSGQSISLIASAHIWNTYATTGHQPAAVEASLSWRSAPPPAAAPALRTELINRPFVTGASALNLAVEKTLDVDRPGFATAATLPLRFERATDRSRQTRDRYNLDTFHHVIDTLIADGLQEAIGYIDEGNFTRAQRALRSTRTRVRDFSVSLDDPAIAERLAHLDAYLQEVESRGLNQLDRKILRSGLSNRFDPPPAESEPKR